MEKRPHSQQQNYYKVPRNEIFKAYTKETTISWAMY